MEQLTTMAQLATFVELVTLARFATCVQLATCEQFNWPPVCVVGHRGTVSHLIDHLCIVGHLCITGPVAQLVLEYSRPPVYTWHHNWYLIILVTCVYWHHDWYLCKYRWSPAYSWPNGRGGHLFTVGHHGTVGHSHLVGHLPIYTVVCNRIKS